MLQFNTLCFVFIIFLLIYPLILFYSFFYDTVFELYDFQHVILLINFELLMLSILLFSKYVYDYVLFFNFILKNSILAFDYDMIKLQLTVI